MIVLSLIYILYEVTKESRQPVVPAKPIKQRPKIDDIVDWYGYNYDVEHYGKDFAESMRKSGRYIMKRRNIYG